MHPSNPVTILSLVDGQRSEPVAFLDRVAYAARHPLAAARRVIRGRQPPEAKVAAVEAPPVPAEHEIAWRRYGDLSRGQGFEQLVAVLSFDCDTPEDIAAAETVHGWLVERGMAATFAVPGTMLEQGAETYRRIAARGAEFINHGWLPHTEWRDGRYWSVTFYNEMSAEAVAEDIHRGHEVVARIIGTPPEGFRAPHFGCIESAEQWCAIYRVLQNLEYRYSSSRMPMMAMMKGPAVKVCDDLLEIPCCGLFIHPHLVFDSWTHIESPERPVVQNKFFENFTAVIDGLQSLGIVGAVNIYVDPAHVVGNDIFRRCLDHLVLKGVPALRFSDIITLALEVKTSGEGVCAGSSATLTRG
jgi:hypothetical protein